MKISVIVRFHNEERFLGPVLAAIRAQRTTTPVEIVAVDNKSTDKSRLIAEQYADRVVEINEYRPGAALNASIDVATGDHVVVLSAHAVPADDRWLENLTAWLRNPAVLACYGAQMYPLTSQFLDKRDLDIFSTLRPRTETPDSDLWNANSTFHRSSWEKESFDETVIELEDHHWTKKILPQGGRWVRFEPSALVYHYGHERRNDRAFLPPGPDGDEERIRAAIDTLSDADQPWPIVMSAGLTLGTLCHSPHIGRAVPVLGQQLLTHPDFDVRWRMAGALARIPDPAAIPYLINGLVDPSFYPRDESAWALARHGAPGVPHLLRAVPSLDESALPFAALALGRSGDDAGRSAACELLRNSIASGHPGVTRDAIYFLGEVADAPGAAGLLPDIVAHLDNEDDEIARGAVWSWGMLAAAAGPEGFDPARLSKIARQHPQETVRVEAVIALARLAGATRSERLLRELAWTLRHDGAGRVRYGAIQALRLFGGARCEEINETVVAQDEDPDFGVRFERDLYLSSRDPRAGHGVIR